MLPASGGTAVSQVANQVQIGARPLGLGGAYTAVANDANAIYWNPAGIPMLQRQEFTTMYSDLNGIGLTQSYLGYVLPFTDNQAAAVDWMHLGFDDSELGYRDDSFNLAYGLRLPWDISVGAKMKYLDRDITLDGTSHGKSSGFGLDFGEGNGLQIGRKGTLLRGWFRQPLGDSPGEVRVLGHGRDRPGDRLR